MLVRSESGTISSLTYFSISSCIAAQSQFTSLFPTFIITPRKYIVLKYNHNDCIIVQLFLESIIAVSYTHLVVLSEDIFKKDVLDILDIKVDITVWNGEKVYERKGGEHE